MHNIIQRTNDLAVLVAALAGGVAVVVPSSRKEVK
jgi:hypothetical protein